MKLNVERLPESQVVLDITADEEEFAKAMDHAVRKVTREIRVPGFRPGHAPRSILEGMFGREIFLEEAHKEIMDDLYKRALDQEHLEPVGTPDVDIVEAEPISFRVQVPVYPTVEPGAYQDVRAEPKDATVDEAKVDEVVERMRRMASPWVDPAIIRPPRDGDQVTIDLAITRDGEPFQEPAEDTEFILGQSNLLSPLRERIEQMSVGDSATVDISFAEDDESVNPEVRGHRLVYTITLKGIKERDLLPVDDELAKTAAEVDTLEELRQQIRDEIHQENTTEARTEVLNQIIEQMAEGATIDLPAVMIDEAVTERVDAIRQDLQRENSSLDEYLRLKDQDEDELRAELRPDAAKRLRQSVLLREIAKREDIEITDEDLNAEIERIAPASADPDRVRELYQSRYLSQFIKNELFDRRLSDRLIEIATEGKGAAINPWVPPAPAETEAETAAEGEGATEPAAEAANITPADTETAFTPAVEASASESATPLAEIGPATAEANPAVDAGDASAAPSDADTAEG